MQTSARLLALLSLLQVRREWSGADLAERLEVDVRTVRRDVDKLRELGYPVQSSRGVAGGYRLGTGARLPPLLLDDAEAVAVAVGLRAAASGTAGEAAIRALTKIEQLLPDRLRRKVRAVSALTDVGGLGAAPFDPEALATLAVAAREQLRADFRYGSATGRVTRRRTAPKAVVEGGIDWYLVALDLDADDWRLFRVDRIEGAVRTAERIPPRELPGGDPTAFVRSRAGGSGGTAAEPGRIRVQASAASVRRRLPAGFATVEPDGAAAIVTSRGPWSPALLFRVLTLDADFELLGPPEFQQAAARLGRRLAVGHTTTAEPVG